MLYGKTIQTTFKHVPTSKFVDMQNRRGGFTLEYSIARKLFPEALYVEKNFQTWYQSDPNVFREIVDIQARESD